MSLATGGLWHQTETLAGRNVRHIVRDPTMLADAVISPVLFLLIFLATFQRLFEEQGIDYTQYLVPMIVIQAMFFAGVTTAVAMAADIERGMHTRLRTLPLHQSAVFTGRLAADLLRVVASLTILLSLAVAIGFRFEAGFAPAVGFVLLSIACGAWLLSGYAAIGLATGNPHTAEGAGLLPFALLGLFTTGFVPRDDYPGWLQPIVDNTPISKTAAALRALSGGGPTAQPVAEAVAWTLPLIIVMGYLATLAYKRAGGGGGGGGSGTGPAPELVELEPAHVHVEAAIHDVDGDDLVARRKEGGVARTSADISHLAVRNLTIYSRRPEELGYNVIFPIAFLLFSVASFSNVVFPGDSGAYIDYILPLAAVQAISFAAISTGVATFEDRESGILQRYRTLPISRVGPLGSRVVSDQARALLQIVILVLVGFVLGFRFSNGFVSAVGFFIVPLVFALWPLCLGILLGFTARSAEGIPAAVFPWLFPLTMFSTGFVPVEAFAGWLQPLVRANPFSAIADTMRALVSGGELAGPLTRTLVWSFGLALVFGVLALRALQRQER